MYSLYACEWTEKEKKVLLYKGETGRFSDAIQRQGDGSFVSISNRPTVGAMMKVGQQDWRENGDLAVYWCTTPVLEIEEERVDYVRFRTKNSTYEWRILNS